MTPDGNDWVFSVSELNRLARVALEKGLSSCRVRGEISNFSRAVSGHWYFTLKDDQAGARCVMFRTRNQSVDWSPRDGDQVELRVQPTLYEARGDYQLLVDVMRKAGQGSLFEAFLKLKAKLDAEGLFSPDRKRPIPKYPRTIGIITSTQAAALSDVLTTISTRWPAVSLILYPAPVQGDTAVRGLIESVRLAGQRRECEVILLVRGGGSLEDLFSFNDESVARAIAACPIPIISGVGHETDFTITDFTADMRAPTPTGAAQMATPSRTDIQQQLLHLNARLAQINQRNIHTISQRLDGLRRRVMHPRERIAFRQQQLRHMTWRLGFGIKSGLDAAAARMTRCDRNFSLLPRITLGHRQRIDFYEHSLHAAMGRMFEGKSRALNALSTNLDLLSPKSILGRGYGIIRNDRLEVIRNANDVVIGERVEITLAQGGLVANVEKVNL